MQPVVAYMTQRHLNTVAWVNPTGWYLHSIAARASSSDGVPTGSRGIVPTQMSEATKGNCTACVVHRTVA